MFPHAFRREVFFLRWLPLTEDVGDLDSTEMTSWAVVGITTESQGVRPPIVESLLLPRLPLLPWCSLASLDSLPRMAEKSSSMSGLGRGHVLDRARKGSYSSIIIVTGWVLGLEVSSWRPSTCVCNLVLTVYLPTSMKGRRLLETRQVSFSLFRQFFTSLSQQRCPSVAYLHFVPHTFLSRDYTAEEAEFRESYQSVSSIFPWQHM